jgi:quinol monooxygenase YgiN
MTSTNEITAVATVQALKGSEEAVADALRKAAMNSRNDEGCIAYEISVDLKDPCIFKIYERWTSEQALRAHIKLEHSQAMFARLKDITDASGGKIERLRPLV